MAPYPLERALRELGIRPILAPSRHFGTWQGGLPQELRLYSLTLYEGTNGYLRRHFRLWQNRRSTGPAARADSAFLPSVLLANGVEGRPPAPVYPPEHWRTGAVATLSTSAGRLPLVIGGREPQDGALGSEREP